jgi:photosystem II stability/assembly factor-like uncharacterized protein
MGGPGRHRRTYALSALVFVLALAGLAQAVVVKDNLYAVKALAPNEAWAVGNFGAIYHTADAGRTWESRDSGVKLPLFGVDFADGTNGWAVGKSAVIVHTADGGRVWKRQKSPIPPEKHLFNVEALDAQTVWAVGDWGAITVTHDGGATWEDHSLGEDVVLYAVSFPDPTHGFISGEFGTILATSDGGTTWEKQTVGTDKTLFGVSFSSAERGWAVGIDGLIVRTRDGGHTWELQRGAAETASIEDLGFLATIENPGLYDVRVVGKEGVVVGDTGVLLITQDGGETWNRYELPEKQRLVWMRGVSLLPGARGFAVGANGFSATIDGGQVVLPGGTQAKLAAP